MSVFSLLAQHADMAVHNLHVAGAMVADAALHGKLAVEHASDHLVVLAQADSGPITVDQFKEKLKDVQQEERVHGLARGAGRIALTRYTLLPLLAVFFLTNPMAYTFGSFLEEKHKPAFYDAAVSYVHPPLGLFPHINPGEYFVWGGILVALLELEKKGVVVAGYHVKVAIWYAIVGLVVILLKGMLTERITAIMARRQGVEL